MTLAVHGITEAEAMRQSPEWVSAVFEQLNREGRDKAKATMVVERARARLFAIVVNVAVAAAMDESGKAMDSLEDLLEELDQDPEEEGGSWLVNPNAKGYDLDAIRAAGIRVDSVPAAADTTAQEATP